MKKITAFIYVLFILFCNISFAQYARTKAGKAGCQQIVAKWEDLFGTNYSAVYTLEVSTNSDFSQIIRTIKTKDTEYLVTGLDVNTEYFYRVKSSTYSEITENHKSVTTLANPLLEPGNIITASDSVCKGANITIECSNASGTDLSYQWQINSGNPLTNEWNNIDGATDEKLVISVTGTNYYRRKVTSTNCGEGYSLPAIPRDSIAVEYNFDYQPIDSSDKKPTTVPGIRGNAFHFDGVDDIICIGDALDNIIDTSGRRSISCWVKSTLGVNQIIFGHRKTKIGTGLYGTKGLINSIIDLSKVIAYTGFANSRWNHLVIVYEDNSAVCFTVWINDTVVYQANGVADNQWGWDDDLAYIGGRCYAGSLRTFFIGKIDDLVVYNKALTQDEVTRLYNSTGVKISSKTDNFFNNTTNITNGSYIWNPAESTPSYATASNWSTKTNNELSLATSAPGTSSNVYIIPSNADCGSINIPTMTDTLSFKSLIISEGLSLNNNGNLEILDSIENNGTFTGNVTFTGSNAILIGRGTTNFNNITISGASFSTEKNVTISGDITNSGNFTTTGGVVTFVGRTSSDNAQKVQGGGTFSLQNIKVNTEDSLKITSTNDLKITGSAEFSKGIIYGNVTFEANATANGANNTSYIDGKTTKIYNSNSPSFMYPIGSSGKLGSLTATQTADVSVEYKHDADGIADGEMPDWWEHGGNMCVTSNGKLHHVSDREYWKLSSSANLTNVTLVSNTSIPSGTIVGNIAVALYGTNNCWENLGGNFLNPRTRENASIGNFYVDEIPLGQSRSGEREAFLTLGSKREEITLPITLTDFYTKCNDTNAEITWITASEVNNDYFILEKSKDAKDFVGIAKIEGAGNSNETKKYVHYDNNLSYGDNYYRLKQVDFDGLTSISNIISVNCIDKIDAPEVQIYPNPVGDNLKLNLYNFDNKACRIEIFNDLGQLVNVEKVKSPGNDYSISINFSDYSCSVYNIRISTDTFVINKRIIKKY